MSLALAQNFALLARYFELLLRCVALRSWILGLLLDNNPSILLVHDDRRFLDKTLLIAVHNRRFRFQSLNLGHSLSLSDLSLCFLLVQAICDLLLRLAKHGFLDLLS